MSYIFESDKMKHALVFSMFPFYEMPKMSFTGLTLNDILILLTNNTKSKMISGSLANKDYVTESEKTHYKIFKSFLETYPDLDKYVLLDQSQTAVDTQGNLLYNKGTNAFTFQNKETGDITISFRGTTPTEWYDNAIGIIDDTTPQLDQALDYVKRMTEKFPNNKITLTGHSKGGNKAMFSLVNCPYNPNFDAICFDSTGISDSLYKNMKRKPDFKQKCAQITCINGEFDYINHLGKSLALPENTHIIEQTKKNGFFSWHAYTSYLQSKYDKNGQLVFTGKINKEIQKPSENSKIFKGLYGGLKNLCKKSKDAAKSAAGFVCMLTSKLIAGKVLTQIGGQRLTFKNAIKGAFDFLRVVKHSPGLKFWDLIKIAKQSKQEIQSSKEFARRIDVPSQTTIKTLNNEFKIKYSQHKYKSVNDCKTKITSAELQSNVKPLFNETKFREIKTSPSPTASKEKLKFTKAKKCYSVMC